MSSSDPNNIFSPYIPMQVTPTSVPPEESPHLPFPLQDKEAWRLRYPIADNALDVFSQGLVDPTFDPGKPYHGINPPEPIFDISIQTVTAPPRKLKALWTPEAAESLKELWGTGGADNALDIFTEGLDDPDFDVNKKYRGRHGKVEQDLIDTMAKEMADEIDREILKDLGL